MERSHPGLIRSLNHSASFNCHYECQMPYDIHNYQKHVSYNTNKELLQL